MVSRIYQLSLKLSRFLFQFLLFIIIIMSCFSNVEHRDNYATNLLGISSISEETVEKIIEVRTQHQQRLYKVHWKDSWLLEDQLKENCCELIKDFWGCMPNTQQEEQNMNLPCFGKTFSGGNTSVNTSDMFNEFVFPEENHDHQQQILQRLSMIPIKDKQATIEHQMPLSHLTPSQEIMPNTEGSLLDEDPVSFRLPIVPTVILPHDIPQEIETNNLDFELDVEEQSDNEVEGEGITYYSNYIDISKLCTKCTAEFQTKCKHCSTCIACRPNSKIHFHNCKGEKVCSVCEHCFDGERCMMCCPYCGQVYPTTLHWKRHVRITHLATSRKQETKKKKLSTTFQKLKDHETSMNIPSISIPEKPVKIWECKLCEKSFLKQHKLRRHEKIHSNVKEFQCHICSKEFVQKVHLQNHLLQHGIGEKRFKCYSCDKWFNHKISLKTHMPKCKIQR